MRYFYDLEFIENGKTIDVIAIGIVAEDGREYYAQRAEMRPLHASQWVQDNVLAHLLPCIKYPAEPYAPDVPDWHLGWAIHDGRVGKIMGQWVHCSEEACPWRKHEEIKRELLAFMSPERYGTPELWGYYAAYDHVALCQFFGTMMDLPKGWPMWTHDLMQYRESLGLDFMPFPDAPKGEHNALIDARWNKAAFEWLMTQSA